MAIKRGISSDPTSPSVPSLTDDAIDYKTLGAPDLTSLHVMMDDPPELDEERLLLRFREALIEKLPRKNLSAGAGLEPDDIITLNSCALVDGVLVPFSANLETQLVLEHLPHLPGFSESILEHAVVGETVQFPINLPADYAAESLRGKTAVFVVQVMDAWRLTGMHEEDNYKALGFGDTLDECMQHLVQLLDEDLANTLLLEAQDKVLRTFSAQVKIPISEDWMHREIQALWQRTEEPALKHFGFDLAEGERALNAWLHDEKTRGEVAHRLRLEVGLAAVQREHEVVVSDKALRTLLFEVGKAAGIRSTDIRENMTPELHAHAERIAQHRALVEYIMERATIRFPSAPRG